MTQWTPEALKRLYSIATQNTKNPGIVEFRKAASELGKSVGSCERKFSRMDWDALLQQEYDSKTNTADRKPWTKADDLQLYELRTGIDKLSYQRIGRIMGRTPISCERRFQRNDWSFIIGDKPLLHEDVILAKTTELQLEMAEKDRKLALAKENDMRHRAKLTDKVVEWLVGTVRAEPDVLKSMTEKIFNAKLEKMLANPDSKFTRDEVEGDFQSIKTLAMIKIDELGMTYPKTKNLGVGRYVVVGESHGKNTASGMFNLLNTINKYIKPDFIIHIGNISDDDDEISYEWQNFDNLIIVGCLSELHLLKKQIYKYNVVRNSIRLGDFIVSNQYDHGDFVKKSVGRIDPLTLSHKTIINTHRHELHSHCSYGEDRLIMSPGCLCRRHTIRTVKQLIFKAGYPHVRQTHPHGFRKYNKQEQDSTRWEQGLIFVEVDTTNQAHAVPCRIYPTSLGHTTSYCGTILGEKTVTRADKRIFINGDLHCSSHDSKILDIQEQFCKDYQPDVHVNVGDMLDSRSLNHHMGGTTGPAFFTNSSGRIEYRDCVDEIASARYILKRMRHWAKESYLILGNHERFAQDFAKRMVQLQDLMSVRTLLDTDGMDIKVIDIKHTLNFDYVKFIHGDVKIWGGAGSSKLERVAINYGPNTVIGNIHYPAIRSGCYSVPMSGLLDQEYNEVDASQWMQGFGYADLFEDKCFVTIITEINNKCAVGGKIYQPRGDCLDWKIPPYHLKIDIQFNDPSELQQVELMASRPEKPRKQSVIHKEKDLQVMK